MFIPGYLIVEPWHGCSKDGLCGSKKYPYSLQGRSLEIPRGRGGVLSIMPKFMEISVGNLMEWSGPSGKLPDQLVGPVRPKFTVPFSKILVSSAAAVYFSSWRKVWEATHYISVVYANFQHQNMLSRSGSHRNSACITTSRQSCSYEP